MTDAKKNWTKVRPHEVKDDDPFKGDLLHRKETCEEWSKFVENATTPFTMAIDASWGDGKSVLLAMWRKQMEQEGFCCVFYDAWQCDFYGDALPTLIGEIQKQIETIKSDKTVRLNEKFKEKAKELSKAIISPKVLLSVAKAMPGGAIAGEVLQEISNNLRGHDKIKQYLDYKKAVEDFKGALANLAEGIRDETQKPLVIFVDELDRCRPDFAIEVLEKVKHLFDIESIFFVFAINQGELLKTIQTVYGDISGEKYLRKFFDRTITLMNAHNLIKHSNWVEDLNRVHIFRHGLMGNPSPQKGTPTVGQFLDLFVNDYRVCARDQEQIVAILHTALLTTKVDYSFCPVLLAYFATLKFANQPLYQESRIAMKTNDISQLPLEKYDSFHQEHVGLPIHDTVQEILSRNPTESDSIRLHACARFCTIRYVVDKGDYSAKVDSTATKKPIPTLHQLFYSQVKVGSYSIDRHIFGEGTTIIEEIEKIGNIAKELTVLNKN